MTNCFQIYILDQFSRFILEHMLLNFKKIVKKNNLISILYFSPFLFQHICVIYQS